MEKTIRKFGGGYGIYLTKAEIEGQNLQEGDIIEILDYRFKKQMSPELAKELEDAGVKEFKLSDADIGKLKADIIGYLDQAFIDMNTRLNKALQRVEQLENQQHTKDYGGDAI